MSEGFDETVGDAQRLLDDVPESHTLRVDVSKAFRSCSAVRMLLWHLLRVKAECRSVFSRPRIDAWEGSLHALLNSYRGLVSIIIDDDESHVLSVRLSELRGSAVSGWITKNRRGHSRDACQNQTWRCPGAVAPGMLALPFLTRFHISRAVLATEHHSAGRCRSQAVAQRHAAQSLVLSALHDAASTVIEIVIPGVSESDEEIGTMPIGDDDALKEPQRQPQSAASSVPSFSPEAIFRKRELIAAASVAAYAQCASVLQLQRVVQTFRMISALSPLFSSEATTFSARINAIATALATFIAVHLSRTLEHCFGLSPSLDESPLPNLDQIAHLPPHFIVPGTAATDAKTAGMAVNPGRAFQILHGLRAAVCCLMDQPEPRALLAPVTAVLNTPIMAMCCAHLQAVTLATLQRVSAARARVECERR